MGYLIIESRDPFEATAVHHNYEIAADLARAGEEVTLFLVENGVLAARPNRHSSLLADLAATGVTIQADEFSLRERGIPADGLAPGIRWAPLESVLDGLANGRRTLWD